MNAQKHGVTAQVPATRLNTDPVLWRLRCDCKRVWQAPTYEEAEDKWRRHVHAETGKAPRPMGDKTDRWEP